MVGAALTTTMSTKGQVILPKALRDELRWGSGTRLLVEQTADGVLLKQVSALFAPTRPEYVAGSLAYAGKPKSLDEMDAGIAAEVQRRHARGRY